MAKYVTEVVREGNTMLPRPAKTWDITLNNYKESDIKWLDSLEVNRMVVTEEVGDAGTKHLQGRMTFKRAYRLSGLKKLNSRAHWEITICKEDFNYPLKVDSIVVINKNNSNQGHRTDLDNIKEDIKNGKSVEDIIMEKPVIYHQYGRTLEKIEDICNRSKIRKDMTEGIWIYGKTGVGKSHLAFADYDPEKCYLWVNDNGWWDGYKGQDTVIMNDYRGEIPYNSLLQLIDKWPMKVRRRNREPMPFVSKKIIITSSLKPEEIYKHRSDEDSIEQLLRRLKIVKLGSEEESDIEL